MPIELQRTKSVVERYRPNTDGSPSFKDDNSVRIFSSATK